MPALPSNPPHIHKHCSLRQASHRLTPVSFLCPRPLIGLFSNSPCIPAISSRSQCHQRLVVPKEQGKDQIAINSALARRSRSIKLYDPLSEGGLEMLIWIMVILGLGKSFALALKIGRNYLYQEDLLTCRGKCLFVCAGVTHSSSPWY